jgi:hypothetical protein
LCEWEKAGWVDLSQSRYKYYCLSLESDLSK